MCHAHPARIETLEYNTERYEEMDGVLRIGPEPERAILLTEKGHALILPGEGTRPIGLAVFFDGWRVTIGDGIPEPRGFDYEALSRSIGILRITTGNPLDFFFDDSTMNKVTTRIQEILVQHDLQRIPLLLTGLSLGGTRALKMAIFLQRNQAVPELNLSSVAIVDAPIDMMRMWHNEQLNIKTNFHPAAADEGRWVSYLLETNLGGTPLQNPGAYRAYSPYTHFAEDGGNAIELIHLPVRAYHEPDVNWWIENRRKSYYQMNSLDLAALINYLKIKGNEKAELVTTYRQRDDFQNNASPHTWSIVDNAELLEWFTDSIE